LLLPRRVVERVGKFDERFWPAYFEDDDYHRRAIQLGVGLGIRTCLAPFRHYRSTTINRYPDLRQHFDRNRLYFIAKHGGTPDELRLPKPPIPAK
jgi:GT2 family glycosyltransferase